MIGLATIVIPPAIAYLSGLDWAGIAGPLGATTITGLLTIIRELATTELESVK